MEFPLSKVGATVGASSLPQGETADEPKGEQDDGQEDAQEGEGVLQNPDPAERGRTRVRPDPRAPPRAPPSALCGGGARSNCPSICHTSSATGNKRQMPASIKTLTSLKRTNQVTFRVFFPPTLKGFRLFFSIP